jgi:hypothetical protein
MLISITMVCKCESVLVFQNIDYIQQSCILYYLQCSTVWSFWGRRRFVKLMVWAFLPVSHSLPLWSWCYLFGTVNRPRVVVRGGDLFYQVGRVWSVSIYALDPAAVFIVARNRHRLASIILRPAVESLFCLTMEFCRLLSVAMSPSRRFSWDLTMFAFRICLVPTQDNARIGRLHWFCHAVHFRCVNIDIQGDYIACFYHLFHHFAIRNNQPSFVVRKKEDIKENIEGKSNNTVGFATWHNITDISQNDTMSSSDGSDRSFCRERLMFFFDRR